MCVLKRIYHNPKGFESLSTKDEKITKYHRYFTKIDVLIKKIEGTIVFSINCRNIDDISINLSY